jgi:hypothetical protein
LGSSVPAPHTELMKSFHDMDVTSLRRFGQPLLGIFDGNLCAAQQKRCCVKLSALLVSTRASV